MDSEERYDDWDKQDNRDKRFRDETFIKENKFKIGEPDYENSEDKRRQTRKDTTDNISDIGNENFLEKDDIDEMVQLDNYYAYDEANAVYDPKV